MEEDGGSRTSSESPSHVSFTCPPPPPPASPPPPPPPPQEESGIQGEESGIQGEESESLPSESNSLVPLSDDLGEKIIRQVEYYFSDENLPTDKFLLKHVKKNKEGFVPIAVIMSFRKMKKLVQDDSLIVDALKKSSQLVVSPDGKRVKRLHPLVDTDIEDAKSRTVLVENLPEDYSENLQHLFGQIGNIKSICIRDPHSLQDSAKTCKAERAISAKLHALVEYDTAEAAQKAVGTLNDEKNWRSGMRVELLQKRMGKYGFAPKSWKGTVSEKSNNSHVAESTDGDENNSTAFDRHHDKTPEEEEEWSLGDKGGRRGRNRGRRGNRPHNGNHHGHGSVSATSATSATSCNDALSRPPPGPKMPDGTRGFTIGRGRPLSNQN